MRQFMYDINLRYVLFIISFLFPFILFFLHSMHRGWCVRSIGSQIKMKIIEQEFATATATVLSDVFIRLQNWQTATCQQPKLINTGKCSCLVGTPNAERWTLNTCPCVFYLFNSFFRLHACDRVQRPWTILFAGSCYYLSDNEICSSLVYYGVCVHMLAWQMQWFMVDHLDYIIAEDVGRLT